MYSGEHNLAIIMLNFLRNVLYKTSFQGFNTFKPQLYKIYENYIHFIKRFET